MSPTADSLARIHRAITRGLGVSTAYAESLDSNGPQDKARQRAFALYTRALAGVMNGHHQGEENAFVALHDRLPDIPYDRLTGEHKEIAALIEQLQPAAARVYRHPDELPVVRQSLEALQALWAPHIGLEEAHISADSMAAQFSADEDVQLTRQLALQSQQHSRPPELAFAFVLYNLEPDDRAAMRRLMPARVVNDLMPNVWQAAWLPMKPFFLD
jgi:hemerythrin-like domain-containing protein